MGLFSKLNHIAANARRADEALYAMALQELSSEDIRPGLWAKAFADSGGDENRTRATYLKLRVQQIKDELATLDSALRRVEAEWGPLGVNDVASTEPPATATPPAPICDSVTPSSDAAYLATGRSSSVAGSVIVLFITALAVLSIYIASRDPPPYRPHAPGALSTPTTIRSEPSAPAVPTQRGAVSPAPLQPAFSAIEQHALIPDQTEAVSTVAGILSIADSTDSFGGHHLELNGRPLPISNDHLHFISITRHGRQDIVLVASQCGGSSCGYLDLAFVRLTAGQPPAVERQEAFRFPSDFTDRLKDGVSIRDGSTEVALGLENGAFWFATIGPAQNLSLSSVPAPIEPLSADDCSLAAEMLDYCTELKTPCAEADFREFPANCPDATMPLYRATNYLASHTTGLNLPAFAQACKAASKLSMAPSPAFIQSDICSGADPIQWLSADAATTSIEGTASAQ